MLADKKIIVGITGSIAAYKAALLVRLFVKQGAQVRVVMTESAKRFVGELTFSNLSQQPVFSGLWDGSWTEHVHLGAWADLMVVAPASANSLAKMAHGICDNALTAVYLSAKCPVLVAPAMDADMYTHPGTLRNLAQLGADGVHVMQAGNGFLASGLYGDGRMAEPEQVLAAAISALTPKPLAGKHVLISAGPTREAIDPVRFISNGSTGTMGFALAKRAAQLGAQVVVVAGPVSLHGDGTFQIERVTSAEEMFAAMTSRSAQQDIIIATAAVGDYQPTEVSPIKIKKGDENLALTLCRTRDILKHLGDHKPTGQLLVGFALETNDEEANALGKMERKHLDYIVLNSLRDLGAGFGSDTNKVTLFSHTGEKHSFELKGKEAVAADIWSVLCNAIEK
jgi:phosphopantothenoylcysteine decarboxylase / phosphopantothenate---cysteine ligase